MGSIRSFFPSLISPSLYHWRILIHWMICSCREQSNHRAAEVVSLDQWYSTFCPCRPDKWCKASLQPRLVPVPPFHTNIRALCCPCPAPCAGFRPYILDPGALCCLCPAQYTVIGGSRPYTTLACLIQAQCIRIGL